MNLDIQGGLKNTLISKNIFVIFEELFSNAIDSYLIRKSKENVSNLSITFTIHFTNNHKTIDENSNYNINISCKDNGAGFENEQIKAFLTKDTTYKDYLDISGVGKCKGAGRIQFFHYFNNIEIDSIFKEENNFFSRKLYISTNSREISENDFTKTPCNIELDDMYTNITLKKLKYIDSINIRESFSAKSVKKHIYITFLQRMVLLKEIVGDFKISFEEIEDDDLKAIEEIKASDIPIPHSKKDIELICKHNNKSNFTLKVTRYSLESNIFNDITHEVALCANSAKVISSINYFLNERDRKISIYNKFELFIIESDFLDQKVNVQRDNFIIPKECSPNFDLIDNNFSLEDILQSVEDYISEILVPTHFDKNALIKSTEKKFGISKSMLDEANIKIQYSDTEENIAKRVLKKYQEDIIGDTSSIIDMEQKLIELNPTTEDFRNKLNDLSWRYTSAIKKMDMANLSQLIVRRNSIIKVLKHSIDATLNCQKDLEDSKKKQNEKIIHNVFFPTGKHSDNQVDHDIWILNEEYHYFKYISSDISLASIPWDKNENLFAEDIDESLKNLFEKNNKEHNKKRPDIAIFNQEGSAIIIEFKAPGVELQEHIPDLAQYSRLLAAKSNGKLKKFYGYLIGTTLNESRMIPGYNRFPSGLGYFNTGHLSDPQTGKSYGELYTEILFYEQFIEKAENRLKIYKDKLNIEF
ncbi:MAG: hypothetical protein RLZZ210_1294 [Pseudomonadota bacterium]|jgi:hypothetical protein